MLTTITVAGTILAQGDRIAIRPDGRVTISVGQGTLTGWPVPRRNRDQTRTKGCESRVF